MLSKVTLNTIFPCLLPIVCIGMQVAAAEPIRISTRTINETRPTYEMKISYPETGIRRIDQEIEGWVRELASDLRRDATDPEAQDARGSRRLTSELSFEVARNDGDVLGLVFTHYIDAGGAHPNSSLRTFHFLLPDGYNAEIAELFTLRGVKRISDLSINQLKASLGGPNGLGDADWIRRGAGPNPANFSRFVLKPDSLRVLFDTYQVAAYAAGPQEVRIPIGRLRDTLRPDPRAPAASFECAHARSDVEISICTSRNLARLDRRLSETYLERVMWAEDDAKEALLRGQQRDWLRLRDASCKGRGPVIEQCLTALYQSRLKALQAPDAP